jgi:hypothetical protein
MNTTVLTECLRHIVLVTGFLLAGHVQFSHGISLQETGHIPGMHCRANMQPWLVHPTEIVRDKPVEKRFKLTHHGNGVTPLKLDS